MKFENLEGCLEEYGSSLSYLGLGLISGSVSIYANLVSDFGAANNIDVGPLYYSVGTDYLGTLAMISLQQSASSLVKIVRDSTFVTYAIPSVYFCCEVLLEVTPHSGSSKGGADVNDIGCYFCATMTAILLSRVLMRRFRK